MLSGALAAAVTPRCAYYILEVISNFIHVDKRSLGSGNTRYGKSEVNQYIVLLICCSLTIHNKKTIRFLLLPML
jgi:hypothetical protein